MHTRFKTVTFGPLYASIATVGYTIYQAPASGGSPTFNTLTIISARITGGVFELNPAASGGVYGATIVYPEATRVLIYWDTAPSGTVFAIEEVNDVAVDLQQQISTSQNAGTYGRVLQLIRARAKGNISINPNTNSETLFDVDGTTQVGVSTLTPSGGPYRGRASGAE